MKILSIIVSDQNKQKLREVTFNEIGISFIYGDIKQNTDEKKTINSLGKTLLLKFIDYIFGANEDKNIVKKDIHNFYLEARVKFKGNIYIVERKLGSSNELFINNNSYSLTKYKEFFEIERSFVHHQLLVQSRKGLISDEKNAKDNEWSSFLKLLNFSTLVIIWEDSKNLKNELNLFKKLKKRMILSSSLNEKEIEENSYLNEKKIISLTAKINDIEDKIKNLDISSEQEIIMDKFYKQNANLKKTNNVIFLKKAELKRLEDFILETEKTNLNPEHVIKMFDKAKFEVPEMIKKDIFEVNNFFQNVYEERRNLLRKKIISLKKEISDLNETTKKIGLEAQKLGKIISENKIYKESINLYNFYSKSLQEEKFIQGQLSQIIKLYAEIDKTNNELKKTLELLITTKTKFDKNILQYRNFIFDLTQLIYSKNVESFFDIKINEKKSKNLELLFTLKGETGEGVDNVKRSLIDCLIFKYNTELEFLIQDSSCYSGVDPRQIMGILNEIEKISIENKKQVIVSLNKFQIDKNQESVKFIEDKSVVKLSENENLLGFDF